MSISKNSLDQRKYLKSSCLCGGEFDSPLMSILVSIITKSTCLLHSTKLLSWSSSCWGVLFLSRGQHQNNRRTCGWAPGVCLPDANQGNPHYQSSFTFKTNQIENAILSTFSNFMCKSSIKFPSVKFQSSWTTQLKL